jgi:hypothetical protein
MGDIHIVWLVSCLGFEPRLALSLTEVCDGNQALRCGPHTWEWCLGGGCGPCLVVASSYTLAFALQLRKITEYLSQGIRKVFGLSAPSAIRLVDWPAGLRRSWLSRRVMGSTLCQRICRVAELGSCLRQLTLSQSCSTNSGTSRSSWICLLRIVHHGADDLLMKQDSVPDGEFRRGPSKPILWAVLFLTWSVWGDQVSRLTRVTPR